MQFVYSHKKLIAAGVVALLSGVLTALGKMTPAQAVAFSTALATALGLEETPVKAPAAAQKDDPQ